MFRSLLDRLTANLPSQCHVCHAWPSRTICEDCVTRWGQPRPRCSRCALTVPSHLTVCAECTANPPPLDACHAAVAYAYPWSECIAQFKFRQQTGWAASFATLMRSTPWVESLLDDAQLLIPMPLSDQRLRQRGFNQAVLLARQLGRNKTRTDVLLRVLDTPAQNSLDRSERLSNVRSAFAVDPLKAKLLVDQRVVLIDDVMTTGASLHAAAQQLRRAGARHISAVVLARTDTD